MDDYSALAYRIAGGVADVRGCLILSRDGLILGSYPDDETAVKPAWVRFASLGDPERSFVEFGDQVWVYVRRPTYGAFAVANAGVRPGLVIDQLEGVLHSAEESRNRRETLRLPEASAAPSGKPRTSLHPSVDAGAPSAPTPATAEARPWARANPDTLKRATSVGRPAAEQLSAIAGDVGRSGEPAEQEGTTPEPAEDPAAEVDDKADTPKDTPKERSHERSAAGQIDTDAEVDPVLLAKEFFGLLQVDSDDDEATP